MPNPYHDKRGRFSTKSAAQSISDGLLKEHSNRSKGSVIASRNGVSVRSHSSDSEGSVVDIYRNGKIIASGDYDSGARAFFVTSNDGSKQQKVFNTAEEVAAFYGSSAKPKKLNTGKGVKGKVIASSNGVSVFSHSSNSEGSVVDIYRDGKVIASGDYDSGARAFFVTSNDGSKQQKVFNTAAEAAAFYGAGGASKPPAPRGTVEDRVDNSWESPGGSILTNTNLVDDRLLSRMYQAETGGDPKKFNSLYESADPKTRRAFQLGYKNPRTKNVGTMTDSERRSWARSLKARQKKK